MKILFESMKAQLLKTVFDDPQHRKKIKMVDTRNKKHLLVFRMNLTHRVIKNTLLQSGLNPVL
jgi:hypothetical protein